MSELGGRAPPVIDAGEFLKAPEAQLRTLCAELGVAFTPRMLRWPPGPRASDGVWAPYWYAGVLASTGFAPYRPPAAALPARLEPLADQCLPYFDRLHKYRIAAWTEEATTPASQRAPAPTGLRSDGGATREGGA